MFAQIDLLLHDMYQYMYSYIVLCVRVAGEILAAVQRRRGQGQLGAVRARRAGAVERQVGSRLYDEHPQQSRQVCDVMMNILNNPARYVTS